MGGFTGPIPESLGWLKQSANGRAWLGSLAGRVDVAAAHWGLRLADPFPYAFASLALPAQREDGSDAVLKVLYADRETEHEPIALRQWAGDGAIRLLDELPSQRALLLERCLPGTPLSMAGPDAAVEVLGGLLPRLWKPATSPPFRTLAEEAHHWSSTLRSSWEAAGRPFAERLLDVALDALSWLPESQGEQVLLHQDLHGGNVLAAQREPWLVIDPKPLVGEREFGLAPIVRSTELGAARGDMIRRLDDLTAGLGLNRERSRLWCLAQTLAWSVGSNALARNVQIAEWLLDA